MSRSSTCPTRRDVLRGMARQPLLVAGAGTGWLLGGSPGTAAAADAPRIDAETAALLDSVVGIDMHSHAAGINGRPEPTYDLAARLRTGRMTAVSLCHASDVPVLRREESGTVVTLRDPRPGEL
jgi:hypothetical protein